MTALKLRTSCACATGENTQQFSPPSSTHPDFLSMQSQKHGEVPLRHYTFSWGAQDEPQRTDPQRPGDKAVSQLGRLRTNSPAKTRPRCKQTSVTQQLPSDSTEAHKRIKLISQETPRFLFYPEIHNAFECPLSKGEKPPTRISSCCQSLGAPSWERVAFPWALQRSAGGSQGKEEASSHLSAAEKGVVNTPNKALPTESAA